MAETTGFQRFIGGLLGEDVEGMTEEERRRLTREGATSAILGMLSGSGLIGGLESYGERRKKSAAEGEVARRQAAAEALMPQVVGRLFGGPAGRLESLPGGEGGELSSRYRQDPRGAMAALYGSQAGRELGQMAPDLAALAKEGTLGSIVGGSVVNRLTGEVTTPAEAPKPKIPERTVDLGGQVIVYFNDGTSQTFQKGMAPGARASGGGGGAPRAPGGAPGAAMPTGILTPEQMRAVNPNFREGSVVYIDPKTGKPQVLQAGAATGAATAGNERMRTGQAMSRDAALQYAANITDTPIAEIRKKTPSEIEALMIKRGGRVLQGGRARTLAGLPGIGGIAKTVIDAANADLMAPATSGGAGIALMQNPTGPITGPDVDVGRMQFPNAMYPIDVQAQMIRSILEQGGQVEEYDEKGNKVR
jgi:hypothetical protein